MTVKIIGHGEQEVWRVTCPRCAAVLEYGRSDVRNEPAYGDDGEYASERRWTECAKCSSRVPVE